MSHGNVDVGLGLVPNTSCSLSTTTACLGNALRALPVRVISLVQCTLLYGEVLHWCAGDCFATK